MAVQPFEIVAGPAEVYIAPTGTAFPAVTVAKNSLPVAWRWLGETEGGVTVSHTQDTELLTTDQTIAPVKAIRTEEGLTVAFSLAQLTLENYAKALDDATLTTTAAGRHRGRDAARRDSLPARGRARERRGLRRGTRAQRQGASPPPSSSASCGSRSPTISTRSA